MKQIVHTLWNMKPTGNPSHDQLKKEFTVETVDANAEAAINEAKMIIRDSKFYHNNADNVVSIMYVGVTPCPVPTKTPKRKKVDGQKAN